MPRLPTEEDRAIGISLWLIPEELTYERLSARIEALASRHGAPRFPPHLTLLGGLTGGEGEVLAAASRVARDTPPLTVRLVSAMVRNEYFRRLVLEAEPSDTLQAARERAASAFAVAADGFEPHLSLLYGRAAIGPGDAGVPLPLACAWRELAVWRTQGAVSEWEPLGRLLLEGQGTA
jgi:hypothetical protein